MSWNYRIVKYRVQTDDHWQGYGLHGVYSDEAGLPWGMTDEPARFIGDNEQEVQQALARALNDALNRPVLEEPEVWPGVNPGHDSVEEEPSA